MREIKFRMWDKQYKIYNENYHICIGMSGEVSNMQDGTGGDDYILEQYTGLKDKNGKEIYEGDIAEDSTGQVIVTQTIKYIGCSFCFGSHNDYLDEWADRLEIIGNIHDTLQ